MWPASLPQEAQLAGLSKQSAGAVIRTAMDVGPAKVRRRTTAAATNWPITIKVTATQLALFNEFYNNSCKAGALAFQWKSPETGNLADFRFLSEPVSTPLAPRQSGNEYWSIGFTLELLPGTEITEVIPPIDPTAIMPDPCFFVIEGAILEPEAIEALAIYGVVPEADTVAPDFFVGTFIDQSEPEALEDPLVAGAAFFVNTATIPGNGGHGGLPGGGVSQG